MACLFQSRLLPSIVLSIIFFVNFVVAASHHPFLLQRRDTFEVTKPTAGDTISIPIQDDYVQIEWTVAADVADYPVAIYLQRGLNISDLETMQVITGKLSPFLLSLHLEITNIDLYKDCIG